MNRKPIWRVRAGRYLPGPLVFAIINLTPDSFYDGGRHTGLSAVLQYCRACAAAGVGVLDLGAESTRPGALPVRAEEEWLRLEPVLTAIAGLTGPDTAAGEPAPAVSVDTYHAGTARQALLAGADIINDISAFNFDPALKEVLLEHRPGYVLMHSSAPPRTMQVAPVYTDVVAEVKRFLETKMNELVRDGFPEEQILLDPGIGFGKTLAHNLELLRRLDCLAELGRPLLIGLSNKSLFGDLLGLQVTERARATQTAVAVLALQNVYAHRVHEALETMQTLELVEALRPERDVAEAASMRASAESQHAISDR